jgi:acetyl-CoA acyltransferase
MSDVYVAGVGMTRFGKFMESSVRRLAEEAVAEALADARITPKDVETAFFANAVGGILTGQEMIRGQVALRHTGLMGIPIVNVENACASASSAFWMANMAIASGAVDIAIAVGSEKLTHADKLKSFAAIGTAVDLEAIAELRRKVTARPPESTGEGGASGGKEKGRSFFMDIYAATTRAYMRRSGATAEDFARVAQKNHGNGALNPKAQYGGSYTTSDILAARPVADPLTVLMCSPISDGAAAVVLCSDAVRARLGAEVRVRSTVLVSGKDEREPGEPGAIPRAVRKAYDQAGVGPEDLDVVEVHDAAAPAELMMYEDLQLCPPGEAPKLVASGETALGGRVPVNPSGGLLAKGHPIGATGCAQIVELVDQLRGRCGGRQVAGARVALAENGGGFLADDPAAVVITVLSR